MARRAPLPYGVVQLRPPSRFRRHRRRTPAVIVLAAATAGWIVGATPVAGAALIGAIALLAWVAHRLGGRL